ncbi:MAG: hypothetical protein AB7P07_14320 [Hyphomonadaceae bacterium]
MRGLLIAAAAGLLAACSVETSDGAAVHVSGDAGPYEMQIAASDAAQIYYVTGPDDRAAAARVENGVSSVIDVAEARLAVGEARAAAADLGPIQDETLAIRVPGFSMTIAAEDDSAPGDSGRAQIAINAGGREVNVDASGDGEADGAIVRISGASEDDARDFIRDAEELSAETKDQMLAALGLN